MLRERRAVVIRSARAGLRPLETAAAAPASMCIDCAHADCRQFGRRRVPDGCHGASTPGCDRGRRLFRSRRDMQLLRIEPSRSRRAVTTRATGQLRAGDGLSTRTVRAGKSAMAAPRLPDVPWVSRLSCAADRRPRHLCTSCSGVCSAAECTHAHPASRRSATIGGRLLRGFGRASCLPASRRAAPHRGIPRRADREDRHADRGDGAVHRARSKERRAALITAAVTGQIDVREAA